MFPNGDLYNVLDTQFSSMIFWGAVMACCGLVLIYESICEKYRRMVGLERAKVVQF